MRRGVQVLRMGALISTTFLFIPLSGEALSVLKCESGVLSDIASVCRA